MATLTGKRFIELWKRAHIIVDTAAATAAHRPRDTEAAKLNPDKSRRDSNHSARGCRASGYAGLEHFHQTCSDVRMAPAAGGLFAFWLRFRSVTWFFKPAPALKPRQKAKILAAHRYIFSVNALIVSTIPSTLKGLNQTIVPPIQLFQSCWFVARLPKVARSPQPWAG